jgi:hypothetical protein
MERFFPRCVDLVRELVLACPRLTRDDRAIECNVGATMGRASLALLRAYPNVGGLCLQEADGPRLAIALERVRVGSYAGGDGNLHRAHQEDGGGGGGGQTAAGGGSVVSSVNEELSAIVAAGGAGGGGGYSLAVSCMGLSRALLGSSSPSDAMARGQGKGDKRVFDGDGKEEEAEAALESYATTLRDVLSTLAPGGHLILAEYERGSSTSTAAAAAAAPPPRTAGTRTRPNARTVSVSAFAHMQVMEEVGFIEVDLAWKRDGFFVCGGRKPPAASKAADDQGEVFQGLEVEEV